MLALVLRLWAGVRALPHLVTWIDGEPAPP
jgi:hypothetical protein